MEIPFVLDTSGSMSDEQIAGFVREVRQMMAADARRRAAHRLWQKKHKPERARNRIRRASRRANRR
jgi:predicted metal-dependent peptidase